MRYHPRHLCLLIVAGLLLAAFALRLYRLDNQSIWWDEGISLHLGTSDLGEIVRDRLNNIHPPLYFFVLRGWLALVGVSAFTGRYLSVLASLGQVALVFSAVRFWSGRSSAPQASLPWVAAFLLLISPLSIIYGQEIRVYAFLPLVYLAILLLAEVLLSGKRLATRPLIYLAAIEWVGIHLHYIALFGVAYISLWGIVVLVRRGDRVGLARWLAIQTMVVLASLPWLAGVIANWPAINAEANAGTFLSDPVPLAYLFSQVWVFHLTGLAGALSSRFVQIGAGVSAVLVVGLLAARTWPAARPLSTFGQRTPTYRLLCHWLIPLVSGLAVWSVRSFSHPRYITMFAVMLIPLSVFLMLPARRRADRAAAIGLAACLVGLSIWSLQQYFFAPGAAKPDMRGVGRYLESTAGPGDLILIPDTDWSLPFEYRGEAAVLMPAIDESPHETNSTLARALGCLDGPPCAQSGRVFVVDYPRGTRDWQDRLPFELARRGYWLNETPFDDLRVSEYHLTDRSGPLPDCESPELIQPAVEFGSLHLESVWVESGAPSDTALTVALCWRATELPSQNASASLILRDPVTGERIAQVDTALINRDGAPSGNWSPGERVITYHILPLPPGTPPIETKVSLGVYTLGESGISPMEAIDDQGRTLGELIDLSAVILDPPLGLTNTPDEVVIPPQWGTPVDAGGGLQLLGARFGPGPYRPGQTIRVGLTWRATTEPLPAIRPMLVLEQEGVPLAENADEMVNGRYPTDQWRQGEAIFEYRDVRIPPGSEGTAQLAIVVGDERIALGEVAIDGADVLFDRPAVHTAVDVHFGDENIRLIGFDPPVDPISPALDVPLTLYWESLNGEIPTGYSVFTHLLAEDGHLIAQHDSPPANGQRPTNEWLPGEFVIDPHLLSWRDPAYTGAARLAVGLYDPATGERLLTADGSDRFYLPLALKVVTAPAE